MNIGEEFRPSPKMMILFFTYLALIMIPLYALGFGVLFLLLFYLKENFAAMVFALVYLLPLTAVALFTMFWIPKYYRSIKYVMTESEVRSEQGVWWKLRRAIPYSRIMNAETIQGPLSRRHKVGTVDIFTAGYTGPSGGGGAGNKRSEAAFMNREDYLELREQILGLVKGRPLFGAPAAPADATSREMLEELKSIRKLLEK